jgi:hypothetical protein
MPVSISGTNGVTFPDSSLQAAAASPYVLKNRIINGDMRIDQRNAGASVSISGGSVIYTLDRWRALATPAGQGVFSVQQSTDAPAGFNNSALLTVTTVDSSLDGTDQYFISQQIEGLNVADLGWGTANAQAVTLSFWVKSSLTGTFGNSLRNSALNRSYPFAYTISSANTWEKKTVTIPGDTTGTWLTSNGTGISLTFSIGTGPDRRGTAGAWTSGSLNGVTGQTQLISTNGATFYITGVQLEVGTSATPFERRLYNQELANCQRYYTKIGASNAYTGYGAGEARSTTAANIYMTYPVPMRAAPTFSQSGTVLSAGGADRTVSSIGAFYAGNTSCLIQIATSGLTAGWGVGLYSNNNTSAYIDFSIEL